MDTTPFIAKWKKNRWSRDSGYVYTTSWLQYNNNKKESALFLLLSGRLVWYYYHQVHTGKVTLRQLETPKCAERTERHFRCLICHSTVGQVGFKICARRFHCFCRNLPIAAVSMFVKFWLVSKEALRSYDYMIKMKKLCTRTLKTESE